MHTPVLLQEVIRGLEIKKGGLYIDATVGEGGHLLEILKVGGRVLGIDRDKPQIENLKKKLGEGDWRLEVGNYADIEEIAKDQDFFPVDGVFFDLGLSMRQLESSKKGLSYKKEQEELDMRLDDENDIRAKTLVNSLNEQELYEIFARFSEELNSRTIAEAIVRSRSIGKIETVGDLLKVIDKTLRRKDERVYARIFQALRIAVNNELENMKKGLEGAKNILKKNGRVAVITFHSLEDRLVKTFIRENGFEILGNKITFGNPKLPYERSAKLRVIIKNGKNN